MRRFGDLLVIDSQDENDFITNEIRPLRSEYWIGLTDQGISKKFHWVDGTPLNETLNVNWRPGEPSNSFGSEDCVEIYGHWLPGKWNDNHCSSIRDYICEKKSGVHNCPDGWVTYKDHCYQINAHPNQQTTWSNARRICLDFNSPWKDKIDVARADLVSITSPDEQKFLETQYRNMKVYRGYFWTGLYKNNSKPFAWTDHSDITYQNWKNGKPDASKNCSKSSLAYSSQGWEASLCTENNYFVCKVKRGQDRCYDPIGIQNHQIPDTSFSASSQLSVVTPPHAAKLYLPGGGNLDGAWCAAENDQNPWIEINLGKPERLTYLGMQGKANSQAFVTGFYIKYSMDGVSWDVYGDIPPAKYFKFRAYKSWRTDFEKVMNLPLPSPLIAQYVRVYPIKAECKENCCLRLELYGCPVEENSKYCGLGWKREPNTKHCYQLNTKKTTWDAAESICKAQGGSLLSIESTTEQAYIKNRLKPQQGKIDSFWTGLNDLDEERIFRFSDQTPLLFNYWSSGFPKTDASQNCAVVQTKDALWSIKDCTQFNEFICKKTYENPYKPKISFNNNFFSSTDYYYKLDRVTDTNNITGTTQATPYGTFSSTSFYINNTDQKYLSFDGKTNYIRIQGIENTCASHPDSNSCPHGFTMSFLFKYSEAVSADKKVLVDSLGGSNGAAGYVVYIENTHIKITLVTSHTTYTISSGFPRSQWNHYAFTFSALEGLTSYVNGNQTGSTHGRSNWRKMSEMVNSLYIGRSAASPYTLTKMAFGSLAMFERVLKGNEIFTDYVTDFGKCGPGQIAHGSYCYEFNSNEVSWNSALRDCQSKNGDLTSIHSTVEQAFMAMNIRKLNKDAWIGLSMKKDTPFKWSDNTAVAYTAWQTGEPNAGYRSYQYTRCVHTVNGTERWNDHYCYSKKGYVCKFTKTLTPSTKTVVRNSIASYYVTMTIGCPLSQKIKILEVMYGSKLRNCYFNKDEAKKLVENKCHGLSCVVKATDSFFGKNPCPTYTWKMLNITYTCVDDTPSVDPVCGNGYVKSSNGLYCYKLMTDQKTFNDAKAACVADKATLAAIPGPSEQKLLTSLLTKLNSPSNVWIGIQYSLSSQQYQWIKNVPVTFTKWFNRQPNPAFGNFSKVGVNTGLEPMLWRAAKGNEELPFFCQKRTDLTTTASPKTTPGQVQPCYKGWSEHNGYCYYVNQFTMSFVDAEKNCSNLAQNAHAASIWNTKENDFVKVLVYNRTGSNPFTWLGLDNEGLVNGFRWKDGTPLNYLNWYPSRPYTGSRHLCGGMESNGQWYDLPCYAKHPSVCKVEKALLLPTTKPTTTPTPDPSVKCAKDWTQFNGSCYYVSPSNAQKDYYAALRDCQTRNGSLASVLSQSENDFIKKEIRRKQGYYTPPNFIGLSQLSGNDGWTWSDDSIVNFLNFAPGQPNNLNSLESCVTMYSTGQWHDSPCNLKGLYICKTNDDMKKVKPTEVVPRDKGYCERGWELYGNSCYKFELEQGHEKNFKDALAYCKSLKGDLASVHSSYENAWILSHAHAHTVNLYIGFTDLNSEKKFIWSDQSSVEYTHWDRNEPSSHGDEDCVEMRTYVQSKGKWNDIGCDKKNGFVCKKESLSVRPTGNLVPTADPSADCPKGFISYRKACYYMAKDKKTWQDAQDSCQRMNKDANLLSVSNIYEQAYLFAHYIEYTNVTWIGLSRDKDQQNFKYIDKARLTYAFWATKPKTTADKRECVSQVNVNSGTWRVDDCNQLHPYICKINTEPIEEETFVGNCTDGWDQYNGLCYKHFNQKSSWAEARKKCVSYGGDLVAVDSYRLQKHLEYMIRDFTQSVWIGLNDRAMEHNFRWSTGESFHLGESYSNWNNKEPNDNYGRENCVEMYSTHGKWNDMPCSYKLSYLCQHPLECNTPAGVENGALADENFYATSFLKTFGPEKARLNGQAGWCTNKTDGSESLTINLQKLMHVTRISTQGAKHNSYRQSWTLSYTLEYSDDYEVWHEYETQNIDGSSSMILPGNRDGTTIASNIVDLRAQYVRLTPKSFKGTYMCLRVEVYGCPSVCLNPLSSIVSSFKTSDKDDQLIQPASLFNNPFCPQKSSATFYQLSFRNPVNINRFTLSSGSGSSHFNYKIIYGLNGKNTTSKDYNSKVSTYRLDKSERATMVTFVLINPDEHVCLNAELYGCLFECNSPLGIADKKIPNFLIRARSSRPGFPASAGRLNDGYFGQNSWCAKTNDDSQYIQVDLTKKGHVTGISTQGFYGEEEKYVTEYLVQYSDDADLWREHSILLGNDDGEIAVFNKLIPAIDARYVRLVPTDYVNGICMRIELHGCPLEMSGGVEPVNPGKNTGDTSTGLSNGGKIGLVIFFILLIAVIIIIGGVYYMRHRRNGFSLHKSFSNPVHMDINNDEIDIINYAE
ncbi:lymphocyte antigen 75-like isoform X2 [Clytia hemisphaerica]